MIRLFPSPEQKPAPVIDAVLLNTKNTESPSTGAARESVLFPQETPRPALRRRLVIRCQPQTPPQSPQYQVSAQLLVVTLCSSELCGGNSVNDQAPAVVPALLRRAACEMTGYAVGFDDLRYVVIIGIDENDPEQDFGRQASDIMLVMV
jgi:hypothetical protein